MAARLVLQQTARGDDSLTMRKAMHFTCRAVSQFRHNMKALCGLTSAALVVLGCSLAEDADSDSGGGSAGSSVSGGAATTAGNNNVGTAGTPVMGGAGSGNGGSSGAGSFSAGSGGQTGGTAAQAGAAGSLTQGGAGGGAGGGGQPGSAGASAGGASGYQPCPTDGSACKILPLGDSITFGLQYEGAYRVELFTKALADQHKITFTGSGTNGPTMVTGQPFPRNHEGHSGWTIDQIAGLVPSPALDSPPHIILLMIGTNDIYAASGQATMPDRLGKLVDKLITSAPNALIVVAKITPLSNASWNATIKTYNDAIPAVVQTRAAAGKHVILGDMNTGFTPAMLSSDSVHPNKSGYDYMGGSWYKTIGSLLH